MLKAIGKFLGIVLIAIILLGAIVYVVVDEPVPNGRQGLAAEQLADEMLAALNKPAFDTLRHIQFTYPGGHSYQWDREMNEVTVRWEENEVFLDLTKSIDEFSTLEYKAYQYFINDSFWLVAPFKVRDQGVIRSTVDVEEGRGLLVTYTTGGVTPGDSYVWIINDKGFPTAWKLWTSNVPIGGLKTGWGGWVEKENVWFSTFHPSAILDLEITELEVAY